MYVWHRRRFLRKLNREWSSRNPVGAQKEEMISCRASQ